MDSVNWISDALMVEYKSDSSEIQVQVPPSATG